jgi:indolepyruvate ferredoxin oxidoreductase
MLPAMRWLARGKRLRGTVLDVFGRTEERRMERQLVREYEALIEELLVGLSADKLELALQLARLPERVRGYGPVKHANVLAVKAQWASTLARYRAPAEALPQEGMPA